jgi:hypothetical protein
MNSTAGRVSIALASSLLATCLLVPAVFAQVPASGLKLWLRSDLGVHASSGLVSQWDDQSGSGNNAIQADPGMQPTLVSAELNGLPVLRFDGADDALGLTGTTPMSQVTLCIVEKLSSGATGNGYYPVALGGDANVTGQYFGIETRNSFSGDSPDILDMFAGFSNDARATYLSITQFDVWRIITASTDQFIANTDVHMEGAQAPISTTGANVAMSVQLGDATGTGFGGVGGMGNHLGVAKCDVAEVLVYDRLLSTSERVQVETYLSSKYAIPLVDCAATPFTDDFNAGSLSPLWLQVGVCGPAVETTGALVLSKPPGCGTLATRGTVGVQSDPASQVVCGDFDVQVDFDLTNLTVPSVSNTRYTGLLVKRASDPIEVGHVAAVERYFQNTSDPCTPYQSAYKFFGDNSDACVSSWVPTSDVQGKFRIIRGGGYVIQLYWDGITWRLGRTAPITREPLAIVLYTGSTYGDEQEVHYDNLQLHLGPTGVDEIAAPSARLSAVVAPNPMNPAGILTFSTVAPGRVSVKVFDLQGRLVRTLLDAPHFSAGIHKITIDGLNSRGQSVATGVYFYRIETPKEIATGRVAILK